jgi:hypothetical protein
MKRKSEALAVQIAAGHTIAEACQKAGVSERSAYRLLGQSDFRARVAELRGQMLARTVARLSDSCVAAVVVLRHLMLKATSETAKLGAAKAILEFTLRGSDLVDHAERIAALEAKLQERDRVKNPHPVIPNRAAGRPPPGPTSNGNGHPGPACPGG